MANLNIADKLGLEPQTITIAEGKTYTVNCGAKTVMKAQMLYEKGNSSFDTLFDIIELLLGKQSRDEIYDMDLSVANLNKVILGIMAQVNEMSYEEMETRFRKI